MIIYKFLKNVYSLVFLRDPRFATLYLSLPLGKFTSVLIKKSE